MTQQKMVLNSVRTGFALSKWYFKRKKESGEFRKTIFYAIFSDHLNAHEEEVKAELRAKYEAKIERMLKKQKLELETLHAQHLERQQKQ
jgi:hypothetical protein